MCVCALVYVCVCVGMHAGVHTCVCSCSAFDGVDITTSSIPTIQTFVHVRVCHSVKLNLKGANNLILFIHQKDMVVRTPKIQLPLFLT